MIRGFLFVLDYVGVSIPVVLLGFIVVFLVLFILVIILIGSVVIGHLFLWENELIDLVFYSLNVGLLEFR